MEGMGLLGKCCSATYAPLALMTRAAGACPFEASYLTRGRPAGNATFDHIPLFSSERRRHQTVTWVPTSTTRPVGIWKKSVASLADLANRMNKWSCQRGMPECAAGRSERRDRKNDVDMMSNCQPSLRATASAFGTLGDSM